MVASNVVCAVPAVPLLAAPLPVPAVLSFAAPLLTAPATSDAGALGPGEVTAGIAGEGAPKSAELSLERSLAPKVAVDGQPKESAPEAIALGARGGKATALRLITYMSSAEDGVAYSVSRLGDLR